MDRRMRGPTLCEADAKKYFLQVVHFFERAKDFCTVIAEKMCEEEWREFFEMCSRISRIATELLWDYAESDEKLLTHLGISQKEYKRLKRKLDKRRVKAG